MSLPSTSDLSGLRLGWPGAPSATLASAGSPGNRRQEAQVLFRQRQAADLVAPAGQLQADRHFVERAFEDAKNTCGMADHKARGWQVWHHHMALAMIALMFFAKERLAHRDITASMLSCHDLIDILRHKLPSKVKTDDDMADMITERHRQRLEAMQYAYKNRPKPLGQQSDAEFD